GEVEADGEHQAPDGKHLPGPGGPVGLLPPIGKESRRGKAKYCGERHGHGAEDLLPRPAGGRAHQHKAADQYHIPHPRTSRTMASATGPGKTQSRSSFSRESGWEVKKSCTALTYERAQTSAGTA